MVKVAILYTLWWLKVWTQRLWCAIPHRWRA